MASGAFNSLFLVIPHYFCPCQYMSAQAIHTLPLWPHVLAWQHVVARYCITMTFMYALHVIGYMFIIAASWIKVYPLIMKMIFLACGWGFVKEAPLKEGVQSTGDLFVISDRLFVYFCKDGHCMKPGIFMPMYFCLTLSSYTSLLDSTVACV